MTEQELATLKEQIKAEIIEEMTESNHPSMRKNQLTPTRRKYINDTRFGRGSKPYREPAPMRTVFDPVKTGHIWELVRRLTCWIMEKSYVQDIAEEDLANEIASDLCEAIINCRKKYLNRNKTSKEE